MTPTIIKKMSKAQPYTVIIPAVASIVALCYIPLSKYFPCVCECVRADINRIGLPWSVMVAMHRRSYLHCLCLFIVCVCVSGTTVSPKGLPSTMSPEHVAANRAYMRYHNMNPIYGISSKRARAADPDP